MEKFTLKNGVDLYKINADKLKTWSANVYIYRPLDCKEASYNALLANVLKTSAKKYPSRKELKKHLNKLYGASISAGVRKFADTHAVVLNISAVCDRFLPEKISDSVADFLKEVLFNPDVTENAFKSDIVELEKTNLIKQIEAYVNDKTTYADKKCIQLLCEDDLYATDVNGSIEEIEKITPESLYLHYKEIIKNSKIVVFLSGNIDETIFKDAFENLETTSYMPVSGPFECKKEVKYTDEVMDVTQGKLVIAFTTDLTSNKYRFALTVFNAVFGGSATSKLFNNVREKLSLAYYANSRLTLSKGIMLARCGIEISKYQAALDEILAQLDEIRNGNVTEDEMENAKAALINVYSSLDDDPESVVALKSGWITENEDRTVEEFIKGIAEVTVDEIIDVAKSFKLRLVYFLKGEE